MPQMAPISWFTLFLYFTMIMILFSIMNYYTFYFNLPSKKTETLNSLSLSWKW
uniref:ATP synthase complex subunit 8 n=1 Tax=Sisyra nigra TaxID=279440 RepID=A0A1S5QY18_9NEOP|nr:ATP synthase F0 subunit 8 [Sisyra nigra]